MPDEAVVNEEDLRRWKLIHQFQERLEEALGDVPLHSSWENTNRRLEAAQYLSTFLFGILNPVLTSMRGLCRATRLERVQQEVAGRRISLGSFSEAQHVCDPELLRRIFAGLRGQVAQKRPPTSAEERSYGRMLEVVDSTLWPVLPRMHWALWRRQGVAQSAVRLHVRYHVVAGLPTSVALTGGKECERRQWELAAEAGACYVGDRYYGEDYGLLQRLQARGCSFLVRLRQSAQWQQEYTRPLSTEDQQANIIEDSQVRLGRDGRGPTVRLIRILGAEEQVILATTLEPQELSAAQVGLCYRHRWEVELFFRWLKHVMGAQRWMAESPRGVAVQIYLTLIGAQLLLLYTGKRPNKRALELLQFYALGWASAEEVARLLQEEVLKKKP